MNGNIKKLLIVNNIIQTTLDNSKIYVYMRKLNYDYLLIGAGLSGSVLAEQISSNLKKKSTNYRKKKPHRR